MVEPEFTIAYDAGARILRTRIAGFWSLATLAAYTARLLAEVARLRGQDYDVLSDARDFAVQGKIVSAGFERIAARGARLHRGRTAIVVASHLSRMQAERTLAATGARAFLDVNEAEEWLTSGRLPA